ncbi:hypothetical protein WME75_36185 [Sorangium sp. So ce1014]|uniref:hypothetical protein n=1 Tax=Sorangium sp. So ce1014 TaxID=3133326 RepID=UPI003F5E86C9
MKESNDRRCAVLVAVQQALLGEVTANLRAVAVTYDNKSIRLEAYFDGEISDEDEEAMSLVETELIAAFPEDHATDVSLIRRPAPEPIPKNRIWAFHRKEPLLD